MDDPIHERPWTPPVHQRYKQRSVSQPSFFFTRKHSQEDEQKHEEDDLNCVMAPPLRSFPSTSVSTSSTVSVNSMQSEPPPRQKPPMCRAMSLAPAPPTTAKQLKERTEKLTRLLRDLYQRMEGGKGGGRERGERSPTSSSSSFYSCTSAVSDGSGDRHAPLTREALGRMGVEALRERAEKIDDDIADVNRHLVRAVKKCAHERAKLRSQCNVVSAVLQALSAKRRVDSQLRFSIDPPATESGFAEWRDAMKAVARLPGGVPTHFRKNLWTTLATQHIDSLGVEWDEVVKTAFSEKLLPEDHLLSSQIIKDVHRTGCPGFEKDEDRVKLKRVLLGYARYNKEIGYCQGFNVIAALVLQVVDGKTDHALKIMIFLIEQVLPRGYFDQSLRALSVDMAVLKELMQERLPKTVAHLDNLRASSGNEFEPEVTKVFTMHWFLTLYATILPRSCVYRIWDAIVLEGSEVLLRTAVAIWSRIGKQVIKTRTADEFYTLMESVCKELNDLGPRDEDQLMTIIYSMAPFPYPGLAEWREKYTWNIQPLSSGFKLFTRSVTHILHEDGKENEGSGCLAVCNEGSPSKPGGATKSEVALLQKQYQLLKRRQKQASLILRTAYRESVSGGAKVIAGSSKPFSDPVAPVFNHLYMGETLLNGNQTEAPCISQGGGAMALAPTIVQPLPNHSFTRTRNTVNVIDGGPEGTTHDVASSSRQMASITLEEDVFPSDDSDDETIREPSRPASRRESFQPGGESRVSITTPVYGKAPSPTAPRMSAEKKAMMKKSMAILDSLAGAKPPPPAPNPFHRPPSVR